MPNPISISNLKERLLLHSEVKEKFNLFNFIFNTDYPEGVTLPYTLEHYLAHDGWRGEMNCKEKATYNIKKRYEKRLRNALNRLERDGIVSMGKKDHGFIWIRPTSSALNLIVRTTEICPPPREPGNRTTSLQRMAANYCLGQVITPAQYKAIGNLFGKYQDSVDSRQVIVCKERAGKIGGEIRSIPSALGNRYVDTREQERTLQKFRMSFRLASTRHDKAVFLTVTIDRSDYHSVLDANRKFSKCLCNLYKKIARRIDKTKQEHETERITVHEFQKDGYLHAHILLFGIDFLINNKVLSHICSGCGLGRIVYAYSLKRNVVSGDLVWSKKTPRNVLAGESAQNYLERYLGKNMMDPEELALYWIFRQRFFTTSRFLTIKDRKKARTPHTVLRCCKNSDAIEMVQMHERMIGENLEYLKGPATA